MTTKFKPMKARFRATYASGATNEPRLGKVDRESRTLHDVQITLEGEARGHGVWLDREFCEDVAKAGNAMGAAGVKVRFGHPAMCSDAIGTYLGRARNFRVVDVTRKDSGERAAGVIADVELDEHADRTEWVLNIAESAPDTFGQSIAFTYSDYKVLDENGVAHSFQAECVEGVEDPGSMSGRRRCKSRDEWESQSADGRVYVVLGKLHGTDFTDTPAATDGVFSDTSLAAEAEQMLDEHPQVLEVLERNPDSVYQFLSRIGLLERLETKRVSGIQAEKDRAVNAIRADMEKSVGELKAIVADRDALLKETVEKSEAEIVGLREKLEKAQASLAALNDEFAKRTDELAGLKAENERLGAAENEAKAALAQTREQLLDLRKKHDDIVGGALNAVRPAPRAVDARKTLSEMPIGERAAFYAAHKNEIDK